eukprot:1814484-Amphidinium_carterae.1
MSTRWFSLKKRYFLCKDKWLLFDNIMVVMSAIEAWSALQEIANPALLCTGHWCQRQLISEAPCSGSSLATCTTKCTLQRLQLAAEAVNSKVFGFVQAEVVETPGVDCYHSSRVVPVMAGQELNDGSHGPLRMLRFLRLTRRAHGGKRRLTPIAIRS